MKLKKPPIGPALLISLAGLGLFGTLAFCVRPQVEASETFSSNNFVTDFDQQVNETLHRLNQESPLGVTVFSDITDFGSSFWIKRFAAIIGLAVVIVSMSLVFARGKSVHFPILCAGLVLAWIAMMAVGETLNLELKEYIKRTRPPYHQANATGYSFPSGHSMAALVAYGMLAYILIRLIPHRKTRGAVIGGLTGLVLLIGFSRAFLGAHWLSDVVGGFAAGACWLGLCISVLEVIPGMSRAAGRATLAAAKIVKREPEPVMLVPESAFPDKTL
jgi:undecaprenyl-diphosphatase